VTFQGFQSRRKRGLDQHTIVISALALMDEVGLDGVTMRSLANRLHVTPGSLYRHVRDKDELLVLLADEISGEVPLLTSDLPWDMAVREMARNTRRVLLRHHDAARVLASIPPAGPRRLRHIERALQVLVDAGFSNRDAAWAAYHFNNLVTEFVADEVRLASAASAAGFSREEVLAEGRAQLAALPEAEFPTLRRLAEEVATTDADAQFEFGLDVWLRGMAALLTQKEKGEPQRPSLL